MTELPTSDPEETYSNMYEQFSNAVGEARVAYLFWRMLRARAAVEQETLQVLNETPLSWIVIRHSLQVTFFIALGRLFDTRGEACSADHLLKFCARNPQIFDKSHLRNRKTKDAGGLEPEWLNAYMQKAHEPTIEDFKKLRSELKKQRKVFAEIHRPIRDKIFARTDLAYINRQSSRFNNKADTPWETIDISHLEGILRVVTTLEQTLFDSFHNGKELTLSDHPLPTADEGDFRQLLDTLVQHYYTTDNQNQ